MAQITETQFRVLEFIVSNIRERGAPPTLREIASYFEWKAIGSAQDAVASLRKKSLLLPSDPGKSRQLVPTPSAFDLVESSSDHQIGSAPPASIKPVVNPQVAFVPVVGLVQAGNPVEAIENTKMHVPFSRQHLKNQSSSYFAVTVDGFSMLNAGFLPGDYVLVDPALQAKNGDIVVAAVMGADVTLKRFALKGSQLYKQSLAKTKFDDMPPALLIPENADFECIAFGLNESDRIVGIARALYRPEIN